MIKAIILQLWYYFREYVNYFQLYYKLILPYLFFLIDSWNCMPFWYLSYFIMEILYSKVVKSLYIKIGLVSIEFQIRFFFNIFITCILIGELGYEKADFYEIWLVKKIFCQSNDKKSITDLTLFIQAERAYCNSPYKLPYVNWRLPSLSELTPY